MKLKWLLSGYAIFCMLVLGVSAELNPSAVYCESMGYKYESIEAPEGDLGYCILPGNETVNAWDFLEGKVAREYSYCAKEGYAMNTAEDDELCSSIFSHECAVCVTENGNEVEVTQIMNLSFDEGNCGDRNCFIGEDYSNCPQDCPSGFGDGYCDGLNDTRCDPDCSTGVDPDCNDGPPVIRNVSCIDNDKKCDSRCVGNDSDCESEELSFFGEGGGSGPSQPQAKAYPEEEPIIQYTKKPEDNSKQQDIVSATQDNTLLYVILALIILVAIFLIYKRRNNLFL